MEGTHAGFSRRERRFTLIELLVVIIIIAILPASPFPSSLVNANAQRTRLHIAWCVTVSQWRRPRS